MFSLPALTDPSEAQLIRENASRVEGNIEVSKTFCEQGRIIRRNVQRAR